MAWLRLDDGFDTHPKLLELSEGERWRWTRLLLHCARHRTEGVVTMRALRDLGLARSRRKLIASSLLNETDDDGIFTVHDWAEYNPKDPTKSERQARWRQRKRDSETGQTRLHVDGPVDGDVDDPTVYKSVSRAQARARGPSRTPTTDSDEEPVVEVDRSTSNDYRHETAIAAMAAESEILRDF